MKILVLTEKHTTRYFDVTSDEQLYKVALFILQRRFNDGFWYVEPELIVPLDFEKEDISKMPMSMQSKANEKWQKHVLYCEKEKALRVEWDDIQKAIATKNGKLAWQILKNRSCYEYEDARIEHCEEPENHENV